MSETNSSTRRDFLKTSAVVAGAALTTNFVASRMAHAAGSDELKIALVGCGGRGSGATGQALNTSNSVSLVAVADAFEDKAKGAVDRFKKEKPGQIAVKDSTTFAGFDAYKKVLDMSPDMVILATPPGFRPIHFEAAVAAGRNIFMEKPVGTDAPGIRRLLKANEEAKKKDLKIGVGLQRHHQQKYIDTIKKIHDGEIGDIILLRVYWNGQRPWVRPRTEGMTEMEFQMRNWYYFTWLCGDHICEQHIHNLDVANWVMKGPPAEAQGTGGRQLPFGPNQGEIFDHHMVEYTYPNGTKMLSMCRHQPDCWNAVSEFAHGTKGTADISGGRIAFADGKEWRYQGPGAGGSRPKRGGEADPYQVEHNDLFNAIRNNTPYNEVEYGAYSSMTAILGRMATYSGQVVTYKDALEKGEQLVPDQFAWDAPTPVKPGPDGLYPCAMPGQTQVLAGDKEKKKKG